MLKFDKFSSIEVMSDREVVEILEEELENVKYDTDYSITQRQLIGIKMRYILRAIENNMVVFTEDFISLKNEIRRTTTRHTVNGGLVEDGMYNNKKHEPKESPIVIKIPNKKEWVFDDEF